MGKLGVVLTGVVLAIALHGHAKETSGTFKVVVNPTVGGRKIPRDVLAQIFLRTAQRWGDGRPIVPVDLSTTSVVREAFTGAVLGMPIDGVKAYWMRSVATGNRPPATKGSEQEVIAFVAAEPGAIGYVADATPVPPTVRVVAIE